MAQVAQRYLCNLLAQQPSNHSTWSLAQILWKLIIHSAVRLAQVCVSAAAPADDDPPSALPLRCAGAAAPPSSISTTRHDDDLGSTGGGGSSGTLCVHKASTRAYDGVVPLHDGSGRLLCWRRNGQIWLATVDVVDPTGGSVLRVGDKPVVDLGTRVSQDAAARGRGLAVHSSGRLFVSYYTTVATDDGGAFLVVDQLRTASWSGHEVSFGTYIVCFHFFSSSYMYIL